MAKVLILDQSKSMRNTLRERLEYEGFSTEAAEDEEAAAKKKKRNTIIGVVVALLCIIGIVFNALGLIMEATGSGISASSLIGTLFVVVLFILANNIKKQA